MAEPKAKPAKREAGRSKFRLPERAPRPAEESPLRALLKEAKEQEAEEARGRDTPPPSTPAKNAAGGSVPSAGKPAGATPAKAVAGVSRRAAPAAVQPHPYTFAEFSRRWSPILRSGQMGVCRALFEMTYETGRAECFTSMPKLALAAGIKERQCYNVVGQLELLGFIERPDIFNTPTQKGTVFRLHMEPRPPSSRAERRYHIGGEEQD